MRDETAIMREALFAIRSQLDMRGLPMKVLASKAGVCTSTFLSWFPAPGGQREPQVPSLAAMAGLARALPADLLSYLVPDGFHIVQAPADINHDDLAAGCIDYASAHARARHPDSPDGVNIAPCEDSELTGRAARLAVAK